MSNFQFIENPTKSKSYTNFELNNVINRQHVQTIEHIKDWIRKQPHLPNVEGIFWS